MKLVLLILSGLGLALLFGFFGWAFSAGAQLNGTWTDNTAALRGLMVLGVLATGALTGVLMWLAFAPSRKGYARTSLLDDPQPRA